MVNLAGKQLPFKTAADRRALVGKSIKYLRHSDIDRSGRGFLFPRWGHVVRAVGKNIQLEDGNWLASRDIAEIVDIEF